MAHQKTEIKTYFGKCKCCLHYAYLKSMWKEEWNEGESVFYGKMLVECFSINWTVNSKPEDDRICDQCISKLHDAIKFKNQVIKCQTDILNEVENVHQDENERMKYESKHAEVDQNSYEYIEFCDDDSDLEDNVDSQVDNTEESERNLKDTEMLEEYISVDDDNDETNERKRKQPKRLPPNERNRSYRQYSFDQLEVAVQAVKCKQMTCQEAAVKYNIPRRTLSTKLSLPEIQSDGEGKEPGQEERNREIELNNHRDNIRSLLIASNATPIKGHWGIGYACAFCPEQFKNPADLKTHTFQHENLLSGFKIKTIKDHVVKLDITNLKCNICEERINSLEYLMEHVKIVHDMPMHFQIPNHIVPFDFGSALKCVRCAKRFDTFKLLSEHMSDQHFRNYVCVNCGRGFVNIRTLKTHSIIHRTGVFTCSYCARVFDTRIKMTDHERIEHKMNEEIDKKKFKRSNFESTFKSLNNHEKEKHKPSDYKCEACVLSFENGTELLSHLRAVHIIHRQSHKCVKCKTVFDTLKELQKHVQMKHSKESECSIRFKTYSSSEKMEKHSQSHGLKHSCEICGRRFVSEENYMTHVKSVHGLE